MTRAGTEEVASRRGAPAPPRRRTRARVGALLGLAVLGLSGCGRHRRVVAPPVVVRPPPVVVMPAPAIILPPPAMPAIPRPHLPAAPRAARGKVQERRRAVRKEAPREAAEHDKNANPTPAPLTAVLGPQETRALRNEAGQWLAATQDNLTQLRRRTLSRDEAATAAQAGEFARQAHQALQQGDVARGHTLAQKALLLTQEVLR